MTVDMAQAVSDFRAFEKAVKSVITIGEVMKDIKNLEASHRFAKNSLDETNSKLIQVKDELKQHDELVSQSKKALVNVKKNAEDTINGSRIASQQLVSAAKLEATNVIDNANKQVISMKNTAASNVSAKEKVLSDLNAEIEKANVEIGLITVELRDLRKRIG